MSSNLSELQARTVIKQMQMLKLRLNTFAAHAKTLRAMSQGKSGIDDRLLLEEANSLIRELMVTFKQYQNANAQTASIGRSLPRSGSSPVSPWKFEMRAASEQFLVALKSAESEVFQLQQVTLAALNDPLRTPSTPGDVGIDNVIDVVTGFIDYVTKWIEHRRSKR